MSSLTELVPTSMTPILTRAILSASAVGRCFRNRYRASAGQGFLRIIAPHVPGLGQGGGGRRLPRRRRRGPPAADPARAGGRTHDVLPEQPAPARKPGPFDVRGEPR